MTDHDDLLTEIGADLEVETSREFGVSVRARVVESRRRSSRIRWALAAAASVGLAWIFVGRPPVGSEVNTTVAVEQPPPAPVVSAQPPIAAPHPTNLRKPSAKVAQVAQVAQVVKTRAVLAPSEPHLEVITNQGAVLRALWAGYAAKPGTLVVIDTAAVESSSAKPILVESIVVPSIVVNEIGKEPGRSGSNDAPRIIRRDHATNATKETR